MSKTFVSVLMGSISDKDIMSHCIDQLKKYNISYEWKVLSAHRTPDALDEYMKDAKTRGLSVIIAAAGAAAHLAGSIAGKTVLPVIGVPLNSSDLIGLDSLLSTVQMPKGIPVATVAIGKAGAINAGILAAQMLALENDQIKEALLKAREEDKKKILQTSIEG